MKQNRIFQCTFLCYTLCVSISTCHLLLHIKTMSKVLIVVLQ
jgi:hypothetical protein